MAALPTSQTLPAAAMAQQRLEQRLEQRLDEWTRRTLTELAHPTPAEWQRRRSAWRRFWDGQYARIGAQIDAEQAAMVSASSIASISSISNERN